VGTAATLGADPATLGTPAVLAPGTAPDAPAATGAICWAGLGKKVAFLPLYTCHWSHSITMEIPKIAHKMVRRMSFMMVSFQKEKRSAG
jgi:hypothetical protein